MLRAIREPRDGLQVQVSAPPPGGRSPGSCAPRAAIDASRRGPRLPWASRYIPRGFGMSRLTPGLSVSQQGEAGAGDGAALARSEAGRGGKVCAVTFRYGW